MQRVHSTCIVRSVGLLGLAPAPREPTVRTIAAPASRLGQAGAAELHRRMAAHAAEVV